MTDAPTGPTILLADDEPLVRRTAERVLTRAGYPVLTATSATEALAVLASAPQVVLLVSDVLLDDLPGPELGRRALALRPDLRVLFMSGETRESLPDFGLDQARFPFLPKPFRPEALLDAVAAILR